VLSSLSGHWSSNEPLSAQLVDALCSTRQHMAGYELSGELFKAAFDIAFYSE
jgi:Zn-dependent oligopeptidase